MKKVNLCLLNELQDNNQEWTLTKKANGNYKVYELLHSSFAMFLEPILQSRKGWPFGSRKENEFTKRPNPSDSKLWKQQNDVVFAKVVGYNSRTYKRKNQSLWDKFAIFA